MALLKNIFGDNKIPGTALGRFIVGLIPNASVRLAVTAGDVTFADIMENVYSDKGDGKIDKDDVKEALKENKDAIKPLVLTLLADVLAKTDTPFLDAPTEEMVEAFILKQADERFDLAWDALMAV